MEKNRPVTPKPERDEKNAPRKEQAAKPRLKIEKLEKRLTPTNGGGSGGGPSWPL
jgi:hypothetical protein